MMMTLSNRKELSEADKLELLNTLKSRFIKNKHRHEGLDWEEILARLNLYPDKIRSLYQMEQTGGEPDVLWYKKDTGAFIFCDCSQESPEGRRSLCYDRKGLDSRKAFKPENSVKDLAAEMGIEILTEQQYKDLQITGNFDTKTSSWLNTPDEIRKLGGALYGDWRYGRVFIYHNGASSYYASRGFRGLVSV